MTSEWKTNVHEGYRTRVIKVGNCTVEINRPILTPEEQKRREDRIIEALKHFGKDHKAFEEQMIATVNSHAKEKSEHSKVSTLKNALITKKDVATLKIGLKRMAVALLTAFLFALSVFSFIATATAAGYWAVALFLAAIVLMGWAFILLYGGIQLVKSKRKSK